MVTSPSGSTVVAVPLYHSRKALILAACGIALAGMCATAEPSWADCPDDEVSTSDGRCMPVGASECGYGHYCPAGQSCSSAQNMCLRPGEVDCGNYKCNAGDECVPGGCGPGPEKLRRENEARLAQLRERTVDVLRRAREEEPAAGGGAAAAAGVSAQRPESHIRQSLPSLPPAERAGKIANVEKLPDRNNGVRGVVKPMPDGSSHIKPSLPPPVGDKKIPEKAKAAATMSCPGGMNSTGCITTPPPPSNNPTAVTIGNPPWKQPGGPPWENQPVPKGGYVYDCIELNQYGCTKWTQLPRNIPSVSQNTGGGAHSNSPSVATTRSSSPGNSGAGGYSIPGFDPTPFVQGRYFVPADCPRYGGASIADDVATFFEVAKGIMKYDPKETKKDICDNEKAAAGVYANAAYVLACLVREYKPHVPADIPQSMYDTVVSQQTVAQTASDDLLNKVEEAERAGECKDDQKKCPGLKTITDQMTSVANVLGYNKAWADIVEAAKKENCSVPDADACKTAEQNKNYSTPGCRSHAP